MGNIQDGLVIWGNEKRIPETSDELPSLYLKKYDLLYNRTNSAELVGKTGIYLGEEDCRTFASYLIRIRCSLEHSLPTDRKSVVSGMRVSVRVDLGGGRFIKKNKKR